MEDQVIHEFRTKPTAHVYVKWIGAVDKNTFREGMDKIIELVKKHKTGKVLSNTSKFGALTEEDQL